MSKAKVGLRDSEHFKHTIYQECGPNSCLQQCQDDIPETIYITYKMYCRTDIGQEKHKPCRVIFLNYFDEILFTFISHIFLQA